jgi:hypothetical protein
MVRTRHDGNVGSAPIVAHIVTSAHGVDPDVELLNGPVTVLPRGYEQLINLVAKALVDSAPPRITRPP